MNRRAQVWLHDRCTGILEENADGFRFTYLQSHVMDARRPISASLPVRSQPYESPRLFPFFEGMLAEGSLRVLQTRQAKLSEDDSFGLLLATCAEDAPGAVTIRQIPEGAT
ncbi:MAG: HipA N-terminal domain-containing protein [Fibrobacteres bacterium]|nr:HipA N-terminal domain-containing protein [Fibrobacterota bacterium]